MTLTIKEKAIIVVISTIVGMVLGGLLMGAIYSQDEGTTVRIEYVDIPLDEVDFKIIGHDDAIALNIKGDDIGTYHTDDYLIRVFRWGTTYYIKIYQEWDGRVD